MNDGGSSVADSGGESAVDGDDGTSPSDAFQALASETRMDVLRTLAAEEPCSFSDLHETSSEETSAGFAYHLRQLTGEFVRQRADERYERTHAGREVTRSVRAGTYTDSVAGERVPLDDACPHCGVESLVAAVDDNVTEIRCGDCERPVLDLSFPPSGYADRDVDAVPEALDTYHRHRIQGFADGVCPDCGGTVRATVDTVGEGDASETSQRAQFAFDCGTCGARVRCPTTLAVLDHPAVVAMFDDHGLDVTDRPLWNVGPEWRERVVSRDPWCSGVSVRLDDETPVLYVTGDGTVIDARRHGPDDEDATAEDSAEQADPAEGGPSTDDPIDAGEEGAGADGATA
jgi:DNA-binding transcriptional ArsR family regulator